jgi:hypothetical protein
MVDSKRLAELEERMRAHMRTEQISDIGYRAFGSRPTEFEWKSLPYSTYEELFEAIRKRTVQVKVVPNAAYLITDKVASLGARALAAFLAIGTFGTPFSALILAYAGRDWRYLLGFLGLIGVFLASPHNRSRSCAGTIGLVLVVVALFWLRPPWQGTVFVLIGPFFLAYAWKSLLIHVAERAALRSDIVMKSLAEDGELVLRWPQTGEIAIPRTLSAGEGHEA